MTDPTPALGPHASARDWAVALTRRRSVTGTAGEAAFGPWLAERLAAAFPPERGRAWTFPVAPGDPRHCVALLVRGEGRATLVLTGHYDTVSTDDYGDLAALATDPEPLAAALLDRLSGAAGTPAEARARADLASGAFLPGRGLLDMKAGLAAGIAAAARFAAEGGRGNLLFLAVPDEEESSAGARRAAPELRAIAQDHGLDLRGAVNLDAVADDGDGAEGRTVSLGTVGKLLPTAFVVGLPTHAGFPNAGLNAAVLLAAIARRVEWAPELTDFAEGPGTPPSLLVLRDGKAGYDVTTPGTAFAAFNVLSVSRSPAEVLDAFDALCREALSEMLATLRGRAAHFRAAPVAIDAVAEVPVLRFAALADRVRGADPAAHAAALAAAPAGAMPDRCRAVTERLWRASGWTGPAVVTGFGSIPYLPTRLSDSPDARRLAAAAAGAAAEVAALHGTEIRCAPVFAGISDMSFLGEADAASLAPVAGNTPGWAEWVRWPEAGGIAGLPIVNAGPWGRDYHTPLERIEVRYGFEVLPDLVRAIARRVLDDRDGRPGPAQGCA